MRNRNFSILKRLPILAQPMRSINHVRRPIISKLRVTLGNCNPPPLLFMDCAERIRTSGHAPARAIMRSAGAKTKSRRYNHPGDPEAACAIADAYAEYPRDITIALRGGALWVVRK